MRLFPDTFSLLDRRLIIPHHLYIASQFNDPDLDHLIWVVFGILSIDLVLLQVQFPALFAQLNAIDEVVCHVLANGSLDRALQLVNDLANLKVQEIEDPRLHRPLVDHGPEKPVQPDEAADVNRVQQLIQFAQRWSLIYRVLSFRACCRRLSGIIVHLRYRRRRILLLLGVYELVLKFRELWHVRVGCIR